jgi:hypothetical protein
MRLATRWRLGWGWFFSLDVAIQINFTIFAASLRIFQEYPQSHCGFFRNICTFFEEIKVRYVS